MTRIRDVVKLTNAGVAINRLKQERDNYRDLCDELLQAVKNSSESVYNNTAQQVCCGKSGQECCGCPDVDWPQWCQQLMNDNHDLITKAQSILGEKQ